MGRARTRGSLLYPSQVRTVAAGPPDGISLLAGNLTGRALVT